MLIDMFDVVAPDWPLPLPPALAPADAIGRPEPADAAGTLLRTARWHAGLSQEELAERAGTSQQTIGRYESGRIQPTLPTLDRLLGSCGMALDHALVPLVDHDDEAIAALLARAPVERLPQPQPVAVRAVVAGLHHAGITVVLTGKAAARVLGAPVLIQTCEFALDGSSITFRSLEAALGRPSDSYWRVSRHDERSDESRDGPVPSAYELDDEPGAVSRLWFGVNGVEIELRAVPEFARLAARAGQVQLGDTPSLIASAADLAARWHAKDRDHLLLQRALLQARRHQPRVVS